MAPTLFSLLVLYYLATHFLCVQSDPLMVWSDNLDEANDDYNWIIYGSVNEATHSNHCPTSMDCWELVATTDKISSSITTSIDTEHYLNLTLSFGITVEDTLSSSSYLRDYCRIYYKTNRASETRTVEHWVTLVSYFYNSSDLLGNKMPLQSFRLPDTDEPYTSIDIRFMNTANDAVPSVSCYIDEISLTAGYYRIPPSVGMKTIYIVLLVVFSFAVFIALIICTAKVYFRSNKLINDEATLVKDVKASIDIEHVDSDSCVKSSAAPSPTATLDAGDARISSNTPISAVSPEDTNHLNTSKPDAPSHPVQSTVGLDAKLDGNEEKVKNNEHDPHDENVDNELNDKIENEAKDPKDRSTVADVRRDTQQQLNSIMHEVLDASSNPSAVSHINGISGDDHTEYIQYNSAAKRESESFQSYDVYTMTDDANAITKQHSQHSVSFADSVATAGVLKNRYPPKQRSITPEESSTNAKDANVTYDSSVAFALYDEEEKGNKKARRKWTQHREEESLEVDTGHAPNLPSQQDSIVTITEHKPAESRKSKSVTEMSFNITIDSAGDDTQNE